MSFEPFEPFELDGVVDEEGNELLPDGTKSPNMTHLRLHKVPVTSVLWEQAPEPRPPSPRARTRKALSPRRRPRTSSSLSPLTRPRPERSSFTAEFGRIWLTTEPEEATEDGTEIQTLMRVYE